MAAYSPYELFRTLVERCGWGRAEDKQAALDSIAEWERVQLFGNLASLMECPHDPEVMTPDGVCGDCGKPMTAAASYAYFRDPRSWADRRPGSKFY